MKNYEYYLDKAKKESGYNFDNQLDNALGFKSAMCCLVRQGKRHLSDKKMIELARLAKEDESEALIYLNIWRAPSNVKETYAAILQKLTRVTASIALIAAAGLTFTAPPALAKVSTQSAESVYYGKYYIKKILKWFAQFVVNKQKFAF